MKLIIFRVRDSFNWLEFFSLICQRPVLPNKNRNTSKHQTRPSATLGELDLITNIGRVIAPIIVVKKINILV